MAFYLWFQGSKIVYSEVHAIERKHRKAVKLMTHTHRNLFKILLNQTEIQLYLPFSDWYGLFTSVWSQINQIMVNTIWFRFGSIRFRRKKIVCTQIDIVLALPEVKSRNFFFVVPAHEEKYSMEIFYFHNDWLSRRYMLQNMYICAY